MLSMASHRNNPNSFLPTTASASNTNQANSSSSNAFQMNLNLASNPMSAAGSFQPSPPQQHQMPMQPHMQAQQQQMRNSLQQMSAAQMNMDSSTHKGSISSLHQQHLQMLQQQQQPAMPPYYGFNAMNPMAHPPPPQQFHLHANPLSSMGNPSSALISPSIGNPSTPNLASPAITSSTPRQFQQQQPPSYGTGGLTAFQYGDHQHPQQQHHQQQQPGHQYPQHQLHNLTPQQQPQTSVSSMTAPFPPLINVGLATSQFGHPGHNMFSSMGGAALHNASGNNMANNQNNPNNSNMGGGGPVGGINVDGNGNDGGDGEQAKEDADNYPSAVLGQPPNSIIVNVSSNNKYGLRNYLVRARRILRLSKTAKICGIGSAVSVACEVTEVLKRERVAHVIAISTGLIEDNVSTRPTLEVLVQRGQFAHLVSDFRRRKVIEVFEKKDVEIRGSLSFDFVRKMDLATKFKADPYRTHQAQKYLQNLENDAGCEAVNLPKFIHYCSIIIHPLLLEYHFKMAIQELGGYVDVHDGHLPREHTEEKVQQLQKLGRIEPFLSDDDDIEFDPQEFAHWFPDHHHMGHDYGGDTYGGGGGGAHYMSHGHHNRNRHHNNDDGAYYEHDVHGDNFGGGTHSAYEQTSSHQYSGHGGGGGVGAQNTLQNTLQQQLQMQQMQQQMQNVGVSSNNNNQNNNAPPPNYPPPNYNMSAMHSNNNDNNLGSNLGSNQDNGDGTNLNVNVNVADDDDHRDDRDTNTHVSSAQHSLDMDNATMNTTALTMNTANAVDGGSSVCVSASNTVGTGITSMVSRMINEEVPPRPTGDGKHNDEAIPEDQSITQDVHDMEHGGHLGDREEDDNSSQRRASSDADASTLASKASTVQ